MLTAAGLRALANGDLDNFIAASTSGGIEAQEARGQKDLCSSSQLPKEIHCGARSDFEAMGVKFGDDADDLFVNVTLPPSWQLRPTDHSMWSDLVDASGAIRAEVFYKAAFYDRKAFMRPVRQKNAVESPQNSN
jgi:hypothetical protein